MNSTPVQNASVHADDVSYFTLATRHTHTSTDSSPAAAVSPSTLPPARSPSPARVPSHLRSKSERGALHTKIKIQTIEEGEPSSHVARRHHRTGRPSVEKQAQDHEEIVRKRPQARRISSTSSSISSAINRLAQELRDESGSSDTHQSNSNLPPRRPRPGFEWCRTLSGGAWYEKPLPSPLPSPAPPGSHSDRTRRRRPPLVRSKNTMSSPVPLPLRPPTRQSDSPTYKHTIRMESSFSKSKEDEQQIPVKIKLASKAQFKRHSSWATRLKKAPAVMASKIKSIPTCRPKPRRQLSDHSAKEAGLEFMSHPTQLRRNRTPETLRRVSSILHHVVNSTTTSSLPTTSAILPRRGRSLSVQSKMSHQSNQSDTTHQPRMTEGIIEHALAIRQKSLDIARSGSDTSSIRQMREGRKPPGTPHNTATYKIKRTPRAQTEEFLKVDISVDGGTSYLPSEARRIHTPPLPETRMHGRRRGFFFDYNAPGSSSSGQHDTPATTERKRAKTGDWYDVQLAAFDTLPKLDQFSVAVTAEEVTIHSQQDNHSVDYHVPEHYPNSPLCPRHERYWRLVDGKMKDEMGRERMRRCWMHG